jgi:predicted MFS family arabinose efflux permease
MPAAPIRLLRNAYGGLSVNIWLLAMVTFINRSGTMVIPFLTVYLTVEKHFTFEQAGMIMSAFGMGSLLGSWLGGWLTDRIGFYPVQLWTLALSGLIFLGLGHLEHFWPLCAGVFLLSTIADAFRPANMTAVSAYSRPENITRSLSLVRMAINLGWSIGPAIGGIFAAHLGYSWLFIADGATCMLSALMLRLFLPPRRARVTEQRVGEDGTEVHRPPHQDGPFLVFIAMITLVAICFMQFLYTLPVYFKKDLGLNEDQIGLLLAMNGLIIGLTEVTAVYLLENRFPKLVLCAAGALVIGLAFFSLNIDPRAAFLSVVCMGLLTVGEILNFPFANSFALTRASARTQGQYMAFYSMAFAMAAIVAPPLGLYLAEHHGFRLLWYFMGGLAILATLGILGVGRMERPALTTSS